MVFFLSLSLFCLSVFLSVFALGRSQLWINDSIVARRRRPVNIWTNKQQSFNSRRLNLEKRIVDFVFGVCVCVCVCVRARAAVVGFYALCRRCKVTGGRDSVGMRIKDCCCCCCCCCGGGGVPGRRSKRITDTQFVRCVSEWKSEEPPPRAPLKATTTKK